MALFGWKGGSARALLFSGSPLNSDGMTCLTPAATAASTRRIDRPGSAPSKVASMSASWPARAEVSDSAEVKSTVLTITFAVHDSGMSIGGLRTRTVMLKRCALINA